MVAKLLHSIVLVAVVEHGAVVGAEDDERFFGEAQAVERFHQLAHALVAHYTERSDSLLDGYSATALRRIWRAERFSAWLTSVLHRFPGQTSFDRGMQIAELDQLVSSRCTPPMSIGVATSHTRSGSVDRVEVEVKAA